MPCNLPASRLVHQRHATTPTSQPASHRGLTTLSKKKLEKLELADLDVERAGHVCVSAKKQAARERGGKPRHATATRRETRLERKKRREKRRNAWVDPIWRNRTKRTRSPTSSCQIAWLSRLAVLGHEPRRKQDQAFWLRVMLLDENEWMVGCRQAGIAWSPTPGPRRSLSLFLVPVPGTRSDRRRFRPFALLPSRNKHPSSVFIFSLTSSHRLAAWTAQAPSTGSIVEAADPSISRPSIAQCTTPWIYI